MKRTMHLKPNDEVARSLEQARGRGRKKIQAAGLSGADFTPGAERCQVPRDPGDQRPPSLRSEALHSAPDRNFPGGYQP